MPNVDGGHYFLTLLVPVRGDTVNRADGSVTSASHALREALASLPTAAQSATSVTSRRRSPFARCSRTHFARLVVLDQPSYNGRDPSNAILQSLRKVDLLAHQPVDRLTTPWLVMAVDFDVTDAPDQGLDAYLQHLWQAMETEMRAIFRFCHGFDQVRSAADFATYLRRCQVETTMPFNDYWTVPFAPPAMSLSQLAGIAGGIFLGGVALAWIVLTLLAVTLHWLWLAVPIAFGLALAVTYGLVMRRGARPFPTAPDSDLPSVLKALYLQQAFAQFVAAHQLDGAAALQTAFGDFIQATKPGQVASPTRQPGIVAQDNFI